MLIGLGLPRTGSTALSYLLAQDRNVRSLRQWEASQPTPPPDIATEDTDPRFLAAQRAIGQMQNAPSELRSMLPTSADGPAECLDLMSMTFRCMALDVMAKTPSYGQWLHRLRLRTGVPVSPPGAQALAVAPTTVTMADQDTRALAQHRGAQPRVSRGALRDHASRRHQGHPLGRECRDRGGAHDDGQGRPAYIGKHCADTWDISLRRFIAFRDRVGEERFYDIAFEDIQSEPIAAIRGLYDWLGEELTPDHRGRDGGMVEDQRRGTRASRRASLPRRGLRARSRPTRRAVRLLRSTIPDRTPEPDEPRSMS